MMRVQWFKNSWLVCCLTLPVFLYGQPSNTPELLGDAVNSDYNEIGPVIAPDGKTLFFSRISHPQNANGDKGSQDIWYSEFRNNKWMNAVRMPNIVNKDVYNAIYSITPDGNTILLKGSYARGAYQTRGFSISKRVRRSWSAPETIEIPDYEKMSKGEFDCGFLSNDGNTLLMSFSEKKKGRNDDLYVSFKGKDGKWSKPQSLGSDVNTADHMETTPFLAADGLTLYFSSDRPGGQGGNDIYSSRRLDGSWRRWSKPLNLGPKVNTPGFEGYYTVAAAGDFAYWSSNNQKETRKGDVYRLSLVKPTEKDTSEKEVVPVPEVIARQTPAEVTAPDPVAMISGKVLDSKTGQPIEASIVFSSFPDGREIGIASTNPETGEYKFTLPLGATYSMRPIAPNFLAETELIDLTDAAMAKPAGRDLLLSSIRDRTGADSLSRPGSGLPEAVAVNTVPNGDTGQPSRRNTGQSSGSDTNPDSTDTRGGTPSGFGIASTTNKDEQRDTTTAHLPAGGGEDSTGKKTIDAGLVAAGPVGDAGAPVGDDSDIELVSSGDTVKAAEAARDSSHVRTYQEFDKTFKAVPIEVGGVVRLNNIFFETASSRIRAESRQELDQLVQILNENPTMRVELGGHTDNEGSDATNQRLSQARTNAVRAFLLRNGIAAGRVESMGYGESKPVASNDTPEGRQANRRVEFTILQK